MSDTKKLPSNTAKLLSNTAIIEDKVRKIRDHLVELDDIRLCDLIFTAILTVQETPELHKLCIGKLMEIKLFYHLIHDMSDDENERI